ncbi:SDR family NAD(P)-dependent oxidoreductase, partial [Candidatus Marinimicrobia bacterium]|nr:SDR family NAD(P)-dependent oxidoreductase [Candidatus Neomarinimicrobiota bacterium]
MSFKNKTVIITGASSGIGQETAKAFLSSGAKVILVSRSKEKMEASFQSYNKSQCVIYPFDLSQLDKIDSFVSTIIKKEGPIDILFNNAGIGSESLFEDIDLSVFHEVMQVDYFSVVYFTKSILRHMIDNGEGQIATNTSVAGLITSRKRTVYSSAKFALHGFLD